MIIKWNYLGILLLFFGLGVQSCCSCRNSAPQEQKTAAPPPTLPPAPLNLPPGVARIVAVPISMDQRDAKSVCILKVEQVVGYGMSTPHVTVGSEIQVEMGVDQDQEQMDQFNSALKQQSSVTLTLRSSPEKTAEIEKSGWKIVGIDKTLSKKSKEE